MGQAEPSFESQTPAYMVTGGHYTPSNAERAEFGAAFTASYRVLWLVAAGITGDAALADDVVQEAALVAMGKLDQFQAGTSFKAWMSQMVRFLALNEQRKRQKRKTATVDPAALESTGAAAGTPPEDELRLGPRGELPAQPESFDDRVLRALSSVGETARACLLLRTIEELEYSEIATLLQIPEGTAMSHVHRSRRLMRERLAAHWHKGVA